MQEFFGAGSMEYSVWASKYQFNGETKDEFFNRLINSFVRSFKYDENLSDYGKERLKANYTDKLRELFYNFRYILPGGSVYSGIGTGKPVSLSNCYVTGIKDSISSIFDGAKNMANIYKRRGGNGTDMTPVRPRGAFVNNAAKTTTGAIPFMNLYSETTRTVGQDGRRGALMLSLDIRHPDSPEFAICKRDTTKLTGANISLKMSEDFMVAVENDEDYVLRWPVDLMEKYNAYEIEEISKLKSVPYDVLFPFTIDGKTKGYTKKIRAKELWDTIIESNWLSGEPGILFWDEIINYDPASVYEHYRAISTNPCGEIPLNDRDACRLVHTNVFELVRNPFTYRASINSELAYKVFYEAQVIADTLVTVELEHIKRIIEVDDEPDFWREVYDIGERGRRTGTGLTGLGDFYAALNVEYGNVNYSHHLMRLKARAEMDASTDLAITDGAFPEWDRDLEFNHRQAKVEGKNRFYQMLCDEFPKEVDRMIKFGRRNISWSTIAPTGTTSMMSKTTSGCEPVFLPFYMRRKKVNATDTDQRVDFTDENGDNWQEFGVLHHKFKDWCMLQIEDKIEGMTKEDQVDSWSEEVLQEAFENSPWFGQTANDLTPEVRIRTQSILQQYTSHSISSTVNLPNDVPMETVNEIYLLASKMGLKGVTTYRDGSRSGVLVSGKTDSSKITERPESIECKVMRFRNEKKNWVAFIGTIDGNPYEIFTGVNDIDAFPIPSNVEKGQIIKVKDGDRSRYDFRYVDSYGYTNTLGGLNRIFNKEYWNYARLTSAILREAVKAEDIIHIISKLEFSNKSMNTWQAGVIRALGSFVADGTKGKNVCDVCGADALKYQEGCLTCTNCGDSKCG